MLPAQGSAFAGEIDTVYMWLFWLSVVLFLARHRLRCFAQRKDVRGDAVRNETDLVAGAGHLLPVDAGLSAS